MAGLVVICIITEWPSWTLCSVASSGLFCVTACHPPSPVSGGSQAAGLEPTSSSFFCKSVLMPLPCVTAKPLETVAVCGRPGTGGGGWLGTHTCSPFSLGTPILHVEHCSAHQMCHIFFCQVGKKPDCVIFGIYVHLDHPHVFLTWGLQRYLQTVKGPVELERSNDVITPRTTLAGLQGHTC